MYYIRKCCQCYGVNTKYLGKFCYYGLLKGRLSVIVSDYPLRLPSSRFYVGVVSEVELSFYRRQVNISTGRSYRNHEECIENYLFKVLDSVDNISSYDVYRLA